MQVDVKCPYCGLGRNSLTIPASDVVRGQKIVLCDCDEGGCDRYFVAFWHIIVEVDVRAIEGQNEAAVAEEEDA